MNGASAVPESRRNTAFEDAENMLNRRATDPVIEMIAHKVVRVEQSIDKLADAVTKLAVVEERQMADRQALERAFAAIERSDERCVAAHEKVVSRLEALDVRIDKLEVAAPTSALTSGWVLEAAKALAITVIVMALTKLGFMK